MPVIRINTFIDGYRLRAQADDLHAMAARRKEATEFVSEVILRRLDLRPSDILIDIGCGDGCLLGRAGGMVSQRIGIVPNREEKQRLERVVPGATILKGICQQLPVAAESVSRIVCNAVLFYLPSKHDVQLALREMARIARPGARLWVGEIPVLDEFEKYHMYRGNSICGLLWNTLTNDSLRALLGMLRRLAMSLVGRDQIVLNSARLFYATPEEFLSLAAGSGLRLEAYFKHREIDREGNLIISPSRYDYVFSK